MKDETDEIKDKLRKRLAVVPPDFSRGLSTGSTLLNLACTGRPDVGYVPGTFYYFVGDSNSGKTFVTLASLAEAANSSHYDEYRLIYDTPEDGAKMNLQRFFGKKMAQRLEPPCWVDEKPWHSETIDEFYFNLDDALEKGPCVYVLDSMDGLTSTEEEKTFQEAKKAHLKGDAKKGSYGDGKAKVNSRFMRRVVPRLEKSGSILVVISQTRDNIGDPFHPRTRSGGRALTFYAQVEIWSNVKRELKEEVRDKKRHTGNECKMVVTRSRFTGHKSEAVVPIYFSHGIDDVGGLVDYLVDEKHWKKEGGRVNAPEFQFKGFREKLIQHIEKENLEPRLRGLAAQVWLEIVHESGVERKRRYE